MANKKLLFPILLITNTIFAYTRPQNNFSIGDISQNLFGAEMNIHDFIQIVCIVSGIALILGGLLKFKKYRRNPVEARLSSVIFDFIIGLILIGLAFIPFQLS